MAQATYSLDVIAKLLDISPRRVQQLSSDGVIPRASRGKYELVPAVQGYIRFLRDRAINADVNEGEEGDHKRRLMKARADIAEMEAERLSNTTVDVGIVSQTWVAACARFRQKMLAIPHKAAPLVAQEEDPDACHDLIEQQIYEALDELVGTVVEAEEPASPRDDGGIEGDETAPETDPESMGGRIPTPVL